MVLYREPHIPTPKAPERPRDKYLEETNRELMRCQARQGERGRAIRHYQDLAELLGEELGSSPATKINTVYERLRRGEEV